VDGLAKRDDQAALLCTAKLKAPVLKVLAAVNVPFALYILVLDTVPVPIWSQALPVSLKIPYGLSVLKNILPVIPAAGLFASVSLYIFGVPSWFKTSKCTVNRITDIV